MTLVTVQTYDISPGLGCTISTEELREAASLLQDRFQDRRQAQGGLADPTQNHRCLPSLPVT